jgi:hypothetical protein
MVNESISRSLSAAGLPNVPEPAHIAQSLRPDGLTTIPFKSGQSLAWDFTAPHPSCASYLHIAHERAGAANECERKKVKKYEPMTNQYIFAPIAIETFGAYGSQARSFIGDISRRTTLRTGDRKAGIYIRQRLSIAIQRGNSKTLQFALPAF